jgi:hypothetical protein
LRFEVAILRSYDLRFADKLILQFLILNYLNYKYFSAIFPATTIPSTADDTIPPA